MTSRRGSPVHADVSFLLPELGVTPRPAQGRRERTPAAQQQKNPRERLALSDRNFSPLL
jgi:hypothetical protein